MGSSCDVGSSKSKSFGESVITDAARPHLTKHLAKRFEQKIGQNVNLLGEVVLGNEEADKRYYSYLEALKEPDINYISVKISGIYATTTSPPTRSRTISATMW